MAYAYVPPALEDLIMPDDPLDRQTGSGALTVGVRFDRLEMRVDRNQERIDEGFRQLTARLDTLATRHEVEAIRGRLDVIEREGSWHVKDLLKALDVSLLERADLRRRVEALERSEAGQHSVSTDRKWILSVILTLVGMVIGVVVGILTHLPTPKP